MGKDHILAGIALAGSVFGEPIKAQEGADNTASRTNKALIELLNELPAGFDKAREVIQWDIVLTEDGDLSDSDKLAIGDHMWKLAETVVAEKAEAVKVAMIDTVIAEEEKGKIDQAFVPVWAKTKILEIDGSGLEKGKNWWSISGLTRKGKITKLSDEGTAKGAVSFELEPVETVWQDFVTITHIVESKNNNTRTVRIQWDFEIQNIDWANFSLEIATVGPDRKTFVDLEKLGLGSSWEIDLEVTASWPLRIRLILQKMPTTKDKSPYVLVDGWKLKMKNFRLTEIRL